MIKVLLVDDSTVYRNTIKTILEKEPEMKVIGQCADGSEVIPFLEHQKPDVILMDYQMPTLNGAETTKLVKDIFPEIRVIGFSNMDDRATKKAFLDNGAINFLSKYEADSTTFKNAISSCFSTI